VAALFSALAALAVLVLLFLVFRLWYRRIKEAIEL